MHVAPGESIALLRQLLNLALPVPSVRKASNDSVQLFYDLLALIPKTPRARRALTLFEAIDVLNLENPHSDFLAWLLDPSGPLKEMWLLRLLLERAAPDQPWPGEPTVEREFAIENGRADIVVLWGSFTLVIENKIWSSEGKQQVARYLAGLRIATKRDGRLIYLTPRGNPPKSVSSSEDRVVLLSYRDLADLIKKGLSEGKETENRGRVFAEEFHRCIMRLIKVRIDMTKPNISEGTKLLVANAKKFETMKQQAIEESADYIDWLYGQSEQRLRRVLGTEMITHRTKDAILFRLPAWKSGEVEFGISYAMRADPRKRLITEQAVDPWVGIGVSLLDGSERKADCQPIADRLHPELKKVWPHIGDMAKPEYSWPLWRYVPIAGGEFDPWSNEVITLMEEMAKTLTPTLTRVADALARG